MWSKQAWYSVASTSLWKNDLSDMKAPTNSKREFIEPHPSDKRYVRRDAEGKFKESDDVGKSLAQDRRQHSKHDAGKGQGDKGDHKR